MSNHLVVRLRVTSVRSRGRNGGVIFTGRKEGGEHCTVVCSYDLVPESSAVQKGQLWQIEGSSQPRTFEVNGFRRTEQQIDASSAELLALGNTNLIDWIANSGCAGIGPAKATRLFERFGESLVEHSRCGNVDLLTEVVSEESALALCFVFEKHKIADTLLWLDRIGVDRRMGQRIAEFYGESARSKIEANPYVLISFATTWSRVDELARTKFKVDAAAPCRLAGALEEILYGAFKSKHTCLPRSALKGRLEDLLSRPCKIHLHPTTTPVTASVAAPPAPTPRSRMPHTASRARLPLICANRSAIASSSTI
jgi:exodeoxyribonuclease V alpha subunit